MLRYSRVLIIVAFISLFGAGCSPQLAGEEFALAYSRSVSPEVYKDNLRGMQKHLTPELQEQLDAPPGYLEEGKRASVSTIQNFLLGDTHILYTQVNLTSGVTYCLRFQLLYEGRKISACQFRILYPTEVLRDFH